MKYLKYLFESSVRRNRYDQFVSFLLENDGECMADGIVSDERCMALSLSRIILFYETGKTPRPNYDDQDVAIELEAIAHFLSDVAEDGKGDHRYVEALKIFRQIDSNNFWNEPIEFLVRDLRQVLRALKGQKQS